MRGAVQHIEIGVVSAWACNEEVMRLYVLLTYKVELHLDLSRGPVAWFSRTVRLEEDIFFNSGGQRCVYICFKFCDSSDSVSGRLATYTSFRW